ncbi:MAG: group 1 truncated hemoglobin [Bacteroidetes bacterium]|nr:group 1 truncated hemoglobin [Bacteroidota bacterium]
MKKQILRIASCLLISSTILLACNKDDNNMPVGSELYQRLGGNAGITKVVDDGVAIVVADPQLAPYFAITIQSQERVDALKANIVDLLGQTVGGPEVYTGLSMKAAHVGMGIEDDDFTQFLVDFTQALQDNGVSPEDQATIGAALESFRVDIVE